MGQQSSELMSALLRKPKPPTNVFIDPRNEPEKPPSAADLIVEMLEGALGFGIRTPPTGRQ